MNRHRWLAFGVGLLVLSSMWIPGLGAVRDIAGILIVLIVPGYLVSRAVIGSNGPRGEAVVFALALSISVVGILGLVLAVFHAFGRIELLASLSFVCLGSVAVEAVRDERLLPDASWERLRLHRLITVSAITVVLVMIVALAFSRDALSARGQQKEASVALAAVRVHGSLKVEVIAGGSQPFSGSLLVEGSTRQRLVLAIREVRPGSTWTAFVARAPKSGFELHLVSGEAEVRRIQIAPIGIQRGGSA